MLLAEAEALKFNPRGVFVDLSRGHGFVRVWLVRSSSNRICSSSAEGDDVLAIFRRQHFIGASLVSGVLNYFSTLDCWPALRTWVENLKINKYLLQAALKAGIVPVVHGDVAFDEVLGGTVASTEDIFAFLARKMAPR